MHFTAEPPNDRDYETISASGQVTGSSAAQPEAEAPHAQEAAEHAQMPGKAAAGPRARPHESLRVRKTLHYWGRLPGLTSKLPGIR